MIDSIPAPVRTVTLRAASNVSSCSRRSLVVMKQPLKLDFLWAGLCFVGAAYFVLGAR